MDHPGGRIIRIEEHSGAKYAEVEVSEGLACPRCASGKGCGAGMPGADRPRQLRANVAAGVDVQVGDSVSIELAPRDLLVAAWLVYGLPMVAAVLGAVLAYIAGLGEAAAVVTALTGLVAGALYSRRRLGHDDCLRRFTPTIVAKKPAVR